MKRFPKSVKLLDEKLATNYREHMFLKNPLVPYNIRNSVSREIHISFKSGKDETNDSTSDLPHPETLECTCVAWWTLSGWLWKKYGDSGICFTHSNAWFRSALKEIDWKLLNVKNWMMKNEAMKKKILE